MTILYFQNDKIYFIALVYYCMFMDALCGSKMGVVLLV